MQRLTRYQPLPAYDKPDDPAWRLMKAILVRWSQEARAPVVIVPIPLYQYVEKSASARAYQARFGELAELPGVTIHDPLPEFHRYPRAQRRGFRFVHDCHLTPIGPSRARGVPGARRARLAAGGRIARRMSVVVLGISGFYHDAAAAIVRDGEIVAAAQEERFSRKKHDPRFPRHAINYCLGEAYVEPSELAAVVFYDNPILSFDRVLKSQLSGRAARSRAVDQGGGVVPRRKALRHALRARLAEVGRARLVHQAPPVPRGIGLLPVAVRAGRDPHHRTAWANGPPPASRAGTAHEIEVARGDPLSPLARAALQRLHRTSAASRSTRASTS